VGFSVRDGSVLKRSATALQFVSPSGGAGAGACVRPLLLFVCLFRFGPSSVRNALGWHWQAKESAFVLRLLCPQIKPAEEEDKLTHLPMASYSKASARKQKRKKKETFSDDVARGSGTSGSEETKRVGAPGPETDGRRRRRRRRRPRQTHHLLRPPLTGLAASGRKHRQVRGKREERM
jgi:hypothetical protein